MIYTTYKGFLIVGKNKNENTEIVQNSKPEDFWFHLEGCSSASAILKVENPNRRDFLEAAEILRTHHKKRNKVIYTKVKNVKIIGVGIFKVRKSNLI